MCGRNGSQCHPVSAPNGWKIQELVFDFDTDSYKAPDLTILSEHVTENGIVEMAYQKEPDSILWCVRDDGVLAAMTYLAR